MIENNKNSIISEAEHNYIFNREYEFKYNQLINEGRSRQYACAAARLYALNLADELTKRIEDGLLQDVKSMLMDGATDEYIIETLDLNAAILQTIKMKLDD